MKKGRKRYENWKSEGFPLWLQERMAERGWNALKLATEIDVVPSLVSRWMTERQRPSDESLRSIARALHLPEEDVFRAAGHLSPTTDTPPEDPRRQELIQKIGAVTLTQDRYLALTALVDTFLAHPDPTDT